MVDKICDGLLEKIRKSDESIDDEKAEIIYYGLQNIIGELPKGIIVFVIAAILGIFELTVIGTIVMMTYRAFAGGVHLKTHWTCLMTTLILIIGSIYFAKEVSFTNPLIIYSILFIFNFIMVTLYAPADTENRPIMKESQRLRQKIECYVMVILVYILSTFIIKDSTISNIFMYMITVESLMITPIAYKIFDNKYGKERKEEIQSSM